LIRKTRKRESKKSKKRPKEPLAALQLKEDNTEREPLTEVSQAEVTVKRKTNTVLKNKRDNSKNM
jgi:hypothetical protein